MRLGTLTFVILCNQHTEGHVYMTGITKSSEDRAYTGEATISVRQAPFQLIVAQI